MWQHALDGDILVRTTEYSVPAHLDKHVEFIQPTTAFYRTKAQRTTFRYSPVLEPPSKLSSSSGTITVPGSGVTVDASCNGTITVWCLKQLYNAVDYVPSEANNNTIGFTGYLEQYANMADLRQFYAGQLPAAVNTSFNVVLINGVYI